MQQTVLTPKPSPTQSPSFPHHHPLTAVGVQAYGTWYLFLRVHGIPVCFSSVSTISAPLVPFLVFRLLQVQSLRRPLEQLRGTFGTACHAQ